MSKKIGRNERCPCGSNKKYKKCCIGKDIEKKDALRTRIIYGDEYASPEMENLADQLKERFPDHEVIDVSKVMDDDTYRPLQMQHYKKKTIMIALRNETNDTVFHSRCPAEVNKMVLYRGAYQCLNSLCGREIEMVYDMITTRLRDEVWAEN